MSVLKTSLAHPSRIQGIFRYLLYAKAQKEKREVLECILSPDKLVEDKSSPRPMFRATLNESIKCGLLVEEEEGIYIALNPTLPEASRNPKFDTRLLPNTLAHLLFASANEDEYDFGFDCAWYLAQDIYDAPGTWETVEQRVSQQQVGDFLKLSSDRLFDQLKDWMCYLGLAWGHALGGKRVTVPDPTLYLKRNLNGLFKKQESQKILLREFIERLAQKCPLFETGQFREKVETQIGQRQPNYLSTSTAFALFRLQDEGYIQLKRESDADLMLLPKAGHLIDDEGRISHIIYCGGEG
ncbi:MAG: protein DpdG [Cyanobacteriota bacterium]|nr:protein DpdG [Cyanobacteriota bacterium]